MRFILFLAALSLSSAPLVAQVPEFAFFWGRAGTNPGQFTIPGGVAVGPEGNVFVCEMFGHRIQRFDRQGNYAAQWGALGASPGQLNIPTDLVIDPQGRVWVAERDNNRIQWFSTSGKWIGALGAPEATEFLGPNGLGLSQDGNFLFVADTNNHRIRKFDIGGEMPIAVADFRDPTDPLPGETDENGETLEPHFFPLDVAITAAGEMVIIELFPQVQVWSATGEVLRTWGTFGAGPSQFNIPAGILVDDSDNIYVSDTLNGRLQKFDIEGQFLLQWGREGERAARLNAPLRAVLAPDGILYVCDGPSAFLNQNRIVAYRLFPTAVQTETWSGIRQRFR